MTEFLNVLLLILFIILGYVVILNICRVFSVNILKFKGGKERTEMNVPAKLWNRFMISQKLVKFIESVPKYQQYELRKIIERYLISICQNEGDKNDVDAKEVLKSELQAKKMGKYYQNTMQILGMKFVVKPDKLVVSEKVDIVTFTYNSAVISLPKLRYQILRKLGSDEDIFLSLLQYESLLPSGQQWAVPLLEYRRYVIDHDVDTEGFASPFNSQLLRLADEFPEKKFGFCSLFPKLDGVFGSLGNFFDLDFRGRTTVVNPPFIEILLDKAAQKCLDELNTHSGKFIFIGPNWTDAKFYTKLSKSEYLMSKRTFKTHYENPNGEEIKSTFESVEFIIERK